MYTIAAKTSNTIKLSWKLKSFIVHHFLQAFAIQTLNNTWQVYFKTLYFRESFGPFPKSFCTSATEVPEFSLFSLLLCFVYQYSSRSFNDFVNAIARILLQQDVELSSLSCRIFICYFMFQHCFSALCYQSELVITQQHNSHRHTCINILANGLLFVHQ